MGRSTLCALAGIIVSASAASAQCYVFSSGSTAFTVNITHLPPPTPTSVSWIWDYDSDHGLVATVSLKVGQTTYTPDPKDTPYITLSLASSPNSNSSIQLGGAFFSPGNVLIDGLASLEWKGNYFLNGSLPATLPSISNATHNALYASGYSSSGKLFDQTLAMTSVGSCGAGGGGTTTTPPVTTPPVTAPPIITPAPPPTLTSVFPTVPVLSSAPQLVTVFGAHFQNGIMAALVFPGGTTFFLTSSQIQGVSDGAFQALMTLSSPGTFAIRVTNPDSQQSNALSFVVVAPGPPAPTIASTSGVVNSASFTQGAVAPGSLASIFGKNFAITNTVASSVPLPSSLAGVSVTINGAASPISGVFHDAINGDQINIQIPWSTPSLSTAQLVVTRDGVSSSPQPIAIAAAVPGVFAVQLAAGKIIGSGLGQAIAYSNADGLIAAQDGAISGLSTHPAKINDQSTLVILATGLGAVDAVVKNGDVPSTPVANTITKPTVTIGGVPAQVVFSGLVGRDASGKAIGFVGVYQINVILAPGTPVGAAVPLQVSAIGSPSRSGVTIAVGQ